MMHEQRKQMRLGAARVALIYGAFGLLWILFSDRVLLAFVDGDAAALARLQTYKGWLFVAVTASLLYLLVRGALAEQAIVERALFRSEARFRAIFEGISDPIFIHDAETGAIEDVNSRAVEIYGYPREQLSRMTIGELSAEDPRFSQAAALEWVRRARAGESPVFEWRARHRDGHVFWVEINMCAADIGDRSLILVTVRDIEARKHAEDALQALNAQLEERVAERTAQLEAANRELESFSYSVSHDLKGPLRGIDGYSQILLEDYRDGLDEDGRQFLMNIRRGVVQMHELIEDLLAYSRMERTSLDARPLDLRALVSALTGSHAGATGDRAVRIEAKVPPIALNADREGLTVVLRNLLENAIKFTRDVPVPAIEIGAEDAGERILIWVRDNGVGFDMKYHERIFEIFQRLHRAEDYPGTGVGLALVKKAVQRMSGRVWAESTPGAGAVFYLELPK